MTESEIIERGDIVFVRDTSMSRDDFETLPMCKPTRARDLINTVKARGGQLCRTLIERDGAKAWHVAAWIYINGTERVTAARVQFGRYQWEV